jgi:Fe-S cluster assembly protein SufD
VTTQTTTLSPLVPELSRRFSEPDWLHAERESAWSAFASMPSPKLEKTDLRDRQWRIETIPNATSGEPGAVAAALLDAAKTGAYVYVRDGVLVSSQLPEEWQQRGVILTDLHTAVAQHPELVRQHLFTVVPAKESKWAALNAALWHGGMFFYVPKNLVVEAPVQFIYEETSAGQGALPRTLVVAEAGSSLTFAEAYLCCGERERGFVHSGVTEVVAGPGARVQAACVSQFTKGPTNYFVRRARLAQDAAVDWVVGDVGDGFSVGLVESRLEGPGSRSTTRGFGLGYGRQRLDLTASMDHYGHHTESDITLLGVMRGRANGTYRSSTHIERGAIEASSEQHDRMLMLDGTARAEAIPMLLIDENDVQRCGHAASVGRIDENQVYYLMARGIPKQEAERMIIWGYLQPLVDALPVEAWRVEVASWIDRELMR